MDSPALTAFGMRLVDGGCAHLHTAGKLPPCNTRVKIEIVKIKIKIKFDWRDRLRGQRETEDANLLRDRRCPKKFEVLGVP